MIDPDFVATSVRWFVETMQQFAEKYGKEGKPELLLEGDYQTRRLGNGTPEEYGFVITKKSYGPLHLVPASLVERITPEGVSAPPLASLDSSLARIKGPWAGKAYGYNLIIDSATYEGGVYPAVGFFDRGDEPTSFLPLMRADPFTSSDSQSVEESTFWVHDALLYRVLPFDSGLNAEWHIKGSFMHGPAGVDAVERWFFVLYVPVAVYDDRAGDKAAGQDPPPTSRFAARSRHAL